MEKETREKFVKMKSDLLSQLEIIAKIDPLGYYVVLSEDKHLVISKGDKGKPVISAVIPANYEPRLFGKSCAIAYARHLKAKDGKGDPVIFTEYAYSEYLAMIKAQGEEMLRIINASL